VQGFSGGVNLDGIRAVVEAVQSIPVIGNGDVRTIAEAERMFEATGCAGVSIGRGALLNPWIFAQLERWEVSGDPGEGPGYFARLDFMARHFHLLVGQRGERYACLTFRKVANWYCRVLKPGREVQQRLVMLDSVATFEGIVDQLRRHGPPPRWHEQGLPELAVPGGPISHW
jgi:tRNA-dihydrouridine synthase